jgi:hypothetical protein
MVAGGECLSAQVISCNSRAREAGRPSRFAGGQRTHAARPQGFVLCFCFIYRTSPASCRMNANENAYPKLAATVFYLDFKGSRPLNAADA